MWVIGECVYSENNQPVMFEPSKMCEDVTCEPQESYKLTTNVNVLRRVPIIFPENVNNKGSVYVTIDPNALKPFQKKADWKLTINLRGRKKRDLKYD